MTEMKIVMKFKEEAPRWWTFVQQINGYSKIEAKTDKLALEWCIVHFYNDKFAFFFLKLDMSVWMMYHFLNELHLNSTEIQIDYFFFPI